MRVETYDEIVAVIECQQNWILNLLYVCIWIKNEFCGEKTVDLWTIEFCLCSQEVHFKHFQLSSAFQNRNNATAHLP